MSQRVRRVPADAATGSEAIRSFSSASSIRGGTCLAVASYRIIAVGTGAAVMTKSGNTWISAIQLRTPPDGAAGRKQNAATDGIN